MSNLASPNWAGFVEEWRKGEHDDCRAYVIRLFNSQDIDIHVTEIPPIFRTAYATEPWICPHGTTYYLEPTSDQIAQWAKDGTP